MELGPNIDALYIDGLYVGPPTHLKNLSWVGEQSNGHFVAITLS